MMKSLTRLLRVSLALMVLAFPAHAADSYFEWVGTTGGGDGANWFDSDNWYDHDFSVGGTLPGSDGIWINNGDTVTADSALSGGSSFGPIRLNVGSADGPNPTGVSTSKSTLKIVNYSTPMQTYLQVGYNPLLQQTVSGSLQVSGGSLDVGENMVARVGVASGNLGGTATTGLITVSETFNAPDGSSDEPSDLIIGRYIAGTGETGQAHGVVQVRQGISGFAAIEVGRHQAAGAGGLADGRLYVYDGGLQPKLTNSGTPLSTLTVGSASGPAAMATGYAEIYGDILNFDSIVAGIADGDATTGATGEIYLSASHAEAATVEIASRTAGTEQVNGDVKLRWSLLDTDNLTLGGTGQLTLSLFGSTRVTSSTAGNINTYAAVDATDALLEGTVVADFDFTPPMGTHTFDLVTTASSTALDDSVGCTLQVNDLPAGFMVQSFGVVEDGGVDILRLVIKPAPIPIESVASGDYGTTTNWDLGVVPVTLDGTHSATILETHDMTSSLPIEVASEAGSMSVLTVNGSLTLNYVEGAGVELDLGFSTTDYTPRSVDSTLRIGPSGQVTFPSCWVYAGYGDVPATNTVKIDLAPGGRLTSDTSYGFGMRLWSEWGPDTTGDGKTWTNNGIDEKDTGPASFEGVLRLLYAEGVLTNNGGQSGSFDYDFIYTPGTTEGSGTLEARDTSSPNIHAFVGTVDTDFLNPANWLSAGTPTPASMAAGDIYLVSSPATLSGIAALDGTLEVASGIAMTVGTGTLSVTDGIITGKGTLTVNGLLSVDGSGTTNIGCPLVLDNPGTPGRVLQINTGATLQTSTMPTQFTDGEAYVGGIWQAQESNLEAGSLTTLKGDGTIAVNSLRVSGILEPGPDSGTGDLTVSNYVLFDSGSTTVIEVNGPATGQYDRILVGWHAEINGALQVDFSGRPFAEAGTYTFLNYTASFSSFSGPGAIGLAPKRSVVYTTTAPGEFSVTSFATAYDDWAYASGLLDSVTNPRTADPNKDGRTNREHFAFDTDPLGDGSDEGKRRARWIDTGVGPRFALTLPVRKGAVFSGSPSPVAILFSDDLRYTIQGSGDLQDWTLNVGQFLPADSDGLPALRDIDGDGTPDWEYHTFFLDDDTLPSGFLRALIDVST